MVHFAYSTHGGEAMEGNMQGCSLPVDKKVWKKLYKTNSQASKTAFIPFYKVYDL